MLNSYNKNLVINKVKHLLNTNNKIISISILEVEQYLIANCSDVTLKVKLLNKYGFMEEVNIYGNLRKNKYSIWFIGYYDNSVYNDFHTINIIDVIKYHNKSILEAIKDYWRF